MKLTIFLCLLPIERLWSNYGQQIKWIEFLGQSEYRPLSLGNLAIFFLLFIENFSSPKPSCRVHLNKHPFVQNSRAQNDNFRIIGKFVFRTNVRIVKSINHSISWTPNSICDTHKETNLNSFHACVLNFLTAHKCHRLYAAKHIARDHHSSR